MSTPTQTEESFLIDGQYLKLGDPSSPEFLERALYGRDVPTKQKLMKYLKVLKKTGCTLTAAAAHARLSYNTIIDARLRFPEFQVLEEISHNNRVVDVDTAVVDKAVTGDVGMCALFYKRRGDLTERVEIIAKGEEFPLEAYSHETRESMLKDRLAFAAKVKRNGK